jgi:pimeloyl-ACP methyl ester carboxylesterase
MRRIAAIGALAVVIAACSGTETPPASNSPSASSPASSPSPEPPELVEGMFDVGGHSLHMVCEGSASDLPTIVYLHGLSHAPGDANGNSSGLLDQLFVDKGYRFCAYDRANTGESDKVPGPLTGKTSARDLDRLLKVAELEPPYLLVAASFGGLVADIYAATHPDDVVGMVQLDTGIPEEIDLEHFFPPEERFRHEKHGDYGWADIEEQIDEFAAYEDAYAVVGKEPTIPLTYLLATPFSWAGGPPGYDKAMRASIDKFAGRYSPGTVKEVESDHYMEAAVPDRIVQEVELLISSE